MDNPAEVIRVPGAPANKKAINIRSLDQFPCIHVVDAAAIKDGDPVPGLPAIYLPQRLADYRMLIYAIVLIAMMLFNWAPKAIEWRQRFSVKKLFHKQAKGVQ